MPGGVMTLAVRPPVQPDTLACGEWDDGKHGNLIEPTKGRYFDGPDPDPESDGA